MMMKTMCRGSGFYSKMITGDDTRKGKRERLEIGDATDH
jgi:hypothetical protein